MSKVKLILYKNSFTPNNKSNLDFQYKEENTKN